MVRDAIEDGERIAQLLASELAALETGSLGALEVTDADRSAEPGPDGPVAYALTSGGDRVGRVRLYPDRAVLELSVPAERVGDRPGTGLSVAATAEGVAVGVESGAAVKRAVDVLRELPLE